MKLKMAENSLFAILLRSPWWISFAVVGVMMLVVRLVLPDQNPLLGALGGIPFIVIGVIAASRQLRAPNAAKVDSILKGAEALSSRDFSAALGEGYRRQGYEVETLSGKADLRISKPGHAALVSCKRWKAASTGIEPLRELHAFAQERNIGECLFITTGTLTDNARRFAADNGIRVVQGAPLAQLLQGQVKPAKAAS